MKKHLSKLGALLVAVLLLTGLTTPAFAAVTSLPDDTSQRILNIYKYSPSTNAGNNGDGTKNDTADDGRIPLQDVEFEIYKVPTAQTTSVTPSTDEVNAIKASGAPFKTVKTNSAGLAVCDFGTGSANDGTYLIIEKDNPAVTQPVAPFYVNIPLTNPDEDAWLYTVNVYPKNDVSGGPTVDKDVNEVNNDTDTHDIGEIQTWIIRGTVPEDLYRTTTGTPSEVYAKNYSFTDELNSALTYKGNIKVTLYDKAGKETVLADTCYNTSGTDAPETPGGIVKVALTEAGMKHVMQNLGTGTITPEIRVHFDTVINDTAILATNIPNDVKLDYTNSANNKYESQTVPPAEVPEVHTGGVLINKYDKSTSAKLDGATFKIARDATPAEIADSSVTTETIKVGTDTKTVVFVKFYDSDSIEGSKVESVTTANGGKAVINGLAYGDYYLIETKAPDGYNVLTGPAKVTINATSHTASATVNVANSKKFELPVTGGAGVMIFTLAGVLFIGIAAILIVATKKKKPVES